LDLATREFFEPRFGYELGHVRVHANRKAAMSAKALDALAYTAGCHLVFGEGQYQPSTGTGRGILAHELAHVEQQSGHRAPVIQRQAAGIPPSDVSELIAEFAAAPLLRWGSRAPAVIRLQQLLNEAGASPLLLTDGVFGKRTQQAVLAFQRRQGLAADGLVGLRTKTALLDAVNEKRGERSGEADGSLAETAGPEARQAFAGVSGGAGPSYASFTSTPTLGAVKGVAKATGRCKYEPGEKKASGKGEVDNKLEPIIQSTGYIQRYLLYDFEAAKAKLKAVHQSYLFAFVDTYDLDSPSSRHKVTAIIGLTDCVDAETKNRDLRQQRAESTYLGLLSYRAKSSNVAKGQAGPPAISHGGSATPEGRARDRAVLIMVTETRPPKPGPKPAPKKPKPKQEPEKASCEFGKDTSSSKWNLLPIRSAGAVVGVIGTVEVFFVLTNLETGCKYDARFQGKPPKKKPGMGAWMEREIDFSGVNFETPWKKLPEDMDSVGNMARLQLVSASLGPLGYSVAFFFPANDNMPTWLNIGGFSLTLSTLGAVAEFQGKFEVIGPE
jgi:peptidoglycan hydrolase-like protein with peptidoglycan-binding domain